MQLPYKRIVSCALTFHVHLRTIKYILIPYKEQQVHNLRQNWVIEIVLRFGIKDV